MRSLLVAFLNATSAVAGHSFQGCGANSAQTDCGRNHRLCKQHELVIKRPFPWARMKKIQENEARLQSQKEICKKTRQDGKRATARGERTRFSGPKGWVPFLGRGFGVFFWVWFSFLVQAGAQSPLSSESFPADSVGNPRPPAKRSQDRYHCPTGCPILQVPVDACAAMACLDEQAARVNTTCCAAYPQQDLTSRQPTCSLFLLHLVAAVTSLGSFVGFPTIFPPKVPYRISTFWFAIAGLVWIASSAKEASLSSSFRTKLVEPKSPKNRKSLKDFRRTFRLARARKTRRFIFSARRVGRARLRARNAKYRRKGRERRLRYLFWFLKGKGWELLRGTRVGEASHPETGEVTGALGVSAPRNSKRQPLVCLRRTCRELLTWLPRTLPKPTTLKLGFQGQERVNGVSQLSPSLSSGRANEQSNSQSGQKSSLSTSLGLKHPSLSTSLGLKNPLINPISRPPGRTHGGIKSRDSGIRKRRWNRLPCRRRSNSSSLKLAIGSTGKTILGFKLNLDGGSHSNHRNRRTSNNGCPPTRKRTVGIGKAGLGSSKRPLNMPLSPVLLPSPLRNGKDEPSSLTVTMWLAS